MSRIKAITRKPYILVLFSVCFVVFLMSFKVGGFRASTSKRQVDFPVKSLVPDLKIIDVKVQDNVVHLSWRNDYPKTITAFSVSSSNIITRTELIDTDKIIAPGATETDIYERPSPSELNEGLKILAAIFDDGTTAGDLKYINQILDDRAGSLLQRSRIIRIFEDGLITPKRPRNPRQWQSLRLRIEQLPEQEEGMSFEFQAALHDEKESAISKIDQLERIQQDKGDSVVQQVLTLMIEKRKRMNVLAQISLNQRQQR